MSYLINKNISLSELEGFFDGAFPSYHPASYFRARLDTEFAYGAYDQEGRLIGFLIYSIWWGNCPFMELIKVREDFRRQGVASALVDKFVEELKEQNFKELVSSTEVINKYGMNFHSAYKFQKLATLDLPHGEEQFFKITL
jgi:GNAT superfamily N-acetyltransferase